MLSPVKTAGSGHGIQPDSRVLVAYTLRADVPEPEVSARFEDRGLDVVPVLPRAEQLHAGHAGHAVVEGADLSARQSVSSPMLKNLISGSARRLPARAPEARLGPEPGTCRAFGGRTG